MECLISLSSSSSAAHFVPKTNNCKALNNEFPLITSHLTSFGLPISSRHRFSVSFKKSSFQDFQDYVKPRRLLPVREIEIFRDGPPHKFPLLLESEESQSLYKLRLRTSSIYGSGLSDMNAGVLICIIDENGDSLLGRIPSILCPGTQDSEESEDFDYSHFATGSVDEFMLLGPKLGQIQAMWIGLESGNWRPDGVSLTTLHAEQNNGNEVIHQSLTYHFEVEDILLGEASDTSMAELRPSHITEYSGVDPFDLPDINVLTLAEKKRMNKESMEEYSDLKISLLLYDSMLIFGGTSISTIFGGKDVGVAFFTGGIFGFFYLLILQRSVDKLAATSESVGPGGVKAPFLALAFALGIGVVLVNRGELGLGLGLGLGPTQILVGVLGFLACKVAVVLSALKPMSTSVQDK